MKKPIQISIPQPCHEKWDEMTPADKGRFCAACQKNVIDFTKASDREIANAIRNNKNLCGRFSNSQLERDLVIHKEKSTVWTAVAAGVLSFVTLGSYKATAQEKQKVVQTENKPVKETNSTASKQSTTIKITVKDSTGFLQEAIVTNVTKKTQTSENKNGVYEIDVSLNDEINIACMGHAMKILIITGKNDLTVLLEELRPIIAVGMVEVKTKPKE
ncbi:hypothetical protein [Flavobacterium alkalisoli]|uniref:hypothetical protein n=1 Tax=Flavobacterium alkalisoli TaxID=2602769 RepID=UPI003A8D1874